MEKSLPADDYASGAWVGKPGHEEEFIERWIEFLEWTRQTFHELNKAILIRDTDEPNRFVWLAYWERTRPPWPRGDLTTISSSNWEPAEPSATSFAKAPTR